MKKIFGALMIGVFLIATPARAQVISPEDQVLIASLQQQIELLTQMIALLTQLQDAQGQIASDIEEISDNQQAAQQQAEQNQIVVPQTLEHVEVTLAESLDPSSGMTDYTFKIYVFDQSGLNTGKYKIEAMPVSSANIQHTSSNPSGVDNGKYYYLLGFIKERFNAGRSTDVSPDTQILIRVPGLGINEVFDLEDILTN